MMILTAILINAIFVLSSPNVSIVSAATSMKNHVSSPSYLRGYYQRNDYNPHSIIDSPINDKMTDENDKSRGDGDGDGDDPKLTDCLLSAVSATDCGSILPKCIWCKEPIAGLCVTESAAKKMNLMPFFTCSLKDDLDDDSVDVHVADERGEDEGDEEEADEEQSGEEYDEVELDVNSMEYGDLNVFAEEILVMEQD